MAQILERMAFTIASYNVFENFMLTPKFSQTQNFLPNLNLQEKFLIEFILFTAQLRIRNRFLQVVRSTLLHLSSLAGPTCNSGGYDISRSFD